MTYKLEDPRHFSRHLQIANRITNAAIKNDNSAEIKDLTVLLKIDTKQPNYGFLKNFRELKNTHPFINDLCQRGGFFGSIGYAFRGVDYRAERYKAIIDQLKQGSYIDKDNNKISYFGTATNFQKSVCEKVEEIKNGYLAKTYTSTGDEIYKDDKIGFEELKNFNENVGFKPSKAMSTDIQTKDDNDMFIWKEFVKANPEYSSLSSNNQDADSIKFTINFKSVQELKQDVLKKLNLPEITKLFTEGGNLNESVGKVIKQQQQKAANKIQKNFNTHVTKSLSTVSDVLRAKLNKVSLIIKNIDTLKVGDIIVVAPANYGLSKNDWYKHGYFFRISSITDTNIIGDMLHLTAITNKSGRSLGNMIALEFYNAPGENGTLEKESVNTTVNFYIDNNYFHESSKLNYLASKGAIFKITDFNFDEIINSFSQVAIQNKHNTYSRQNNCNHIIYETFIDLYKTKNLKF